MAGAGTRVRFGDFTLDRGSRQLLRGSEERHLGHKAFDLLDLLLRHRPDVVPRERIRDRVWPGTFISESTLATVVGEVRAALKDDPRRPQFIRTIHGVGFAFCGDAVEVAAAAAGAAQEKSRFRLLLDDREIRLHEGENLLGRCEEGVAWIESASVSRRHARIVVSERSATLEDLGSKNGTFLRGQRLSAPTPLTEGDEFWLGKVPMVFKMVHSDRSTRTDDAE